MANPGYRHQFLFLGHSYARRLNFYTNTHPSHQNLGFDWDRVHIIGSRGQYNISYLRHVLGWITRYANFINTVDVTCLIIGSNDVIDPIYIGQPHQLAQDILQAAQNLLTAGSKRVVVLPILFRSGMAAVPRAQQSTATQDDIDRAEKEYMDDVIEINRLVKEGCEADPRLSFRTLRGLKANWRNSLADGTHLTYRSMRTFFNDVRSALVVEKGRLYQ